MVRVYAWTLSVLRAAVLAAALGLVGSAGLPAAEAAACDLNYCRSGGCISTKQVRQQVRSSYGGGWSVSRVRLVSNAPTPTCLWYEVRLTGPGGARDIAYWNVTGGRAR